MVPLVCTGPGFLREQYSKALTDLEALGDLVSRLIMIIHMVSLVTSPSYAPC